MTLIKFGCITETQPSAFIIVFNREKQTNKQYHLNCLAVRANFDLQQGACELRVTERKMNCTLRHKSDSFFQHITNACEVQTILTVCTDTSKNYLWVCVRLSASVGSRCFALRVVFQALELLQVFGIWALHEADTEHEHLIWHLPCFHSWSLPPFYFFLFSNHPDYRLSGPARIPFLTHQNGDIHLKDDICGEFPNNLIVIRRRRGRRGRYDGGE